MWEAMATNLTEVLEAAMSLPASAREELASKLLESLPLERREALAEGEEDELDPAAVEAEWAAELQRRMDDVESGRVQCEPWPVVYARLQEMISKHRAR